MGNRGMMGGGMMGGGGDGGPSRAIFLNQLPPNTTYEELCDAVGAFGNLESIKILEDKKQAFVNFVDAQAAMQLMMTTGQQIVLRAKSILVHWGKTRPLQKELLFAIRSGATRNLYLSNVPDTLADANLS